MNYYVAVLKKYAVFSGRAQRAEYWYFVLFNFIICVILGAIDSVISWGSQSPMMVLSGLYSLAVLIPSLAVLFRRLHDTGRSGWWILIVLIPIIGSIWLLVLMVLDSSYGDNKYGPNPKGISSAPAAPTPAV